MRNQTSSVRVWIVGITAALVVFVPYQYKVNSDLSRLGHDNAHQAVQLREANQQALLAVKKTCTNGKKSAGGIINVSQIAIRNIHLRAGTLHGHQKKVALAGIPLWQDLIDRFQPQADANC